MYRISFEKALHHYWTCGGLVGSTTGDLSCRLEWEPCGNITSSGRVLYPHRRHVSKRNVFVWVLGQSVGARLGAEWGLPRPFSFRLQINQIHPPITVPVSLWSTIMLTGGTMSTRTRWYETQTYTQHTVPPVLSVRWSLLKANEGVARRVERQATDAVSPLLLRPKLNTLFDNKWEK